MRHLMETCALLFMIVVLLLAHLFFGRTRTNIMGEDRFYGGGW